jgi:hypothetical protein
VLEVEVKEQNKVLRSAERDLTRDRTQLEREQKKIASSYFLIGNKFLRTPIVFFCFFEFFFNSTGVGDQKNGATGE